MAPPDGAVAGAQHDHLAEHLIRPPMPGLTCLNDSAHARPAPAAASVSEPPEIKKGPDD
jgi:hypothetical protein